MSTLTNYLGFIRDTIKYSCSLRFTVNKWRNLLLWYYGYLN